MTRKLFHLAMAGLIGFALIAPLGGCGDTASQSKPTIDMTTPLKAPSAPSTQKVEIKPIAKGAKK